RETCRCTCAKTCEVTMAATTPQTVAIDATVLINLCHVSRLDLLESLVGYRFVVSDEVYSEVTEPSHRTQIDALVARGNVAREQLSGMKELAEFASLNARLGVGESSCIAIAESRSWIVACDDRRAIAEITRRLGNGMVMTTPGFFVL